jgi:BlaI family transcriptional regulator, penicillinase repressor
LTNYRRKYKLSDVAPTTISDAELAVLKVLWELRSGTVSAVRERYNERHGRELAYNTLLTFLRRLEQKGAVRVDKEREPYVYRPAQKEKATLRDRVQRFVDTVFDGRMDDLILHLIEEEAISPQELARIRGKLEQAPSARVGLAKHSSAGSRSKGRG